MNTSDAMSSSASASRVRPYIVCGLATLFYVYEFYLRVMPSAMTHELMADFNVTARGLGFVTALFYYGYTPMQIPAGLLYDRWGPRVLLTLATLICTLATFAFGITSNPVIAGMSRFMIGFASAFAFVGALVLASRWFEAKHYALIAGLVQFMGAIGAIGGEAPVAFIVHHFGWRNTMLGSALVGLVIAVLLWTQITEHPDRKAVKQATEGDNELTRLKKVSKNAQMWAIALYAFCIWAPITIFASLWGIPFLKTLYHVNTTVAATAVAFAWLGVAIGSPLFGWWSDKIGRRNVTLMTSSVFALIASLAILYLPQPPSWPIMYALLFCFGVGASGQVISFGVVQDLMPPSVAGTATGFNNMAVIASGVLVQPVVGFILHAFWAGHLLNGVHIYTLHAYRVALSSVPVCALVGLLTCAFLIKETYCRRQAKDV